MDVSNDAVVKATGETWGTWFKRCGDAEKSGRMSHKDLADFLNSTFELSFWWSQQIVVEYEKHTGRRALGETKESGFQVGVSRTVPCSAEEGWRRLFSEKGQSLWLDEDLMLAPEEGEVFDGARVCGEVRVWKPLSHIRLTWQEKGMSSPSVLQIRCTPKGEDRCVISFHHEKLADAEARQKMKVKWTTVLDELKRGSFGQG